MAQTKRPQLIGLAGTFSAGKDTVAKALVRDFDYNHVSTSEMVRKYARERYGSIERPILFRAAQELRQEQGAAALVLEAIKEDYPLVVSGLRSLGEAKAIKDNDGVLIFVDAPIEVRYDRMKLRTRDDETKLSLEEFELGEQKEWYGGPAETDFNLRDIKAMADIVIDSSAPIDDFIQQTYQKLDIG